MGILAYEQPDIRPRKESGQLYILMQDWMYRGFLVPQGFLTDGASAPKWTLSVVGFQRDGIHRAAAMIHDWLYVNKGTVVRANGSTFTYDRLYADKQFKGILKEAGVKNWQAWCAYYAVRLGGRLYWNHK